MVIFGRYMSPDEYKILKSKHILIGSKEENLIPVFEADPSTIKKLSRLSKKDIKELFTSLGAKGKRFLVYFQTNMKPVIGPIPQKYIRWIKEFKFRSGIEAEPIEA